MPMSKLEFAEPFFTVRLISDEPAVPVSNRAIVLNLSEIFQPNVIKEKAA